MTLKGHKLKNIIFIIFGTPSKEEHTIVMNLINYVWN
ncbi:hypothetical protein Leryth_002459 [Lithospermum erythrorhizon]|nr:hypothetical protein Leryth_002459 [Lithospermum erythrorhizon]